MAVEEVEEADAYRKSMRIGRHSCEKGERVGVGSESAKTGREATYP